VRFEWKPYVPVAARRRQAAQEMARLQKKTGRPTQAVVIDGAKIATTFWGKAWCDNLESYSDYANRLPRGRTYVRNGSVVDLALAAGKVTARVSGSSLYTVEIEVAPLPPKKWASLCAQSAGAIDSVVELLQGRFAKGVMERLCQPRTGLFPTPTEMTFSCSCPDWASMCKHVAASLYGVGARLDRSPELFFTLRQVDEKDLIAQAGAALAKPGKTPASHRLLSTDGLEELFGLDMGAPSAVPDKPARKPPKRKAAAGRKEPPAPKVLPRRKANPPPFQTRRGTKRR
jgi:uncharacterized Zn finger protein